MTGDSCNLIGSQKHEFSINGTHLIITLFVYLLISYSVGKITTANENQGKY